jgi:MFS transporter, FHS family, Na+ dependent glucose transporter 1
MLIQVLWYKRLIPLPGDSMTTPTSIELPVVAARRRTIITIIYYAGFIILGLTAASLGPTLTDLAANTRSTLGQISFLFTARSLGYMLGSVLAGRLYDRLPGHLLMTGGLLVLGLTLGMAPIIPILALLTGVFLLMGIAEGLFDVGGNTLLVWVHGENVSPFMNALHFFFGFGAFITPMIVAWTVQASGGIRLAYWTLALLAVLPALGLLTQPSPLSPHAARESVRSKAQASLLTLLILFFFLYVGAEVSFGGWIFTYAKAQNLAGEVEAAYLTSAFWGAFTAGRLISIPIARRLRPRTMLLIDLVGCLMSAGLMLALPNSHLAVWVGAIGVGLFMASIFPTAILLASRRLDLTGFTTSLFFLGSSFGAMLMPLLIGQLFDRLGPPVTMLVILSAVVLDLFVFIYMTWRFPPSHKE